MPTLFSSLTIGALTLRNRILMAPMTRNRADPAGNPQPIMATYYAQRATAGLIISEATQVCPEGVGIRALLEFTLRSTSPGGRTLQAPFTKRAVTSSFNCGTAAGSLTPHINRTAALHQPRQR